MRHHAELGLQEICNQSQSDLQNELDPHDDVAKEVVLICSTACHTLVVKGGCSARKV
jgi:hypothetical protein